MAERLTLWQASYRVHLDDQISGEPCKGDGSIHEQDRASYPNGYSAISEWIGS